MSATSTAALTNDLGLLRGMSSSAQAALRQLISAPDSAVQRPGHTTGSDGTSALELIDSFRPQTGPSGRDPATSTAQGEEAQKLARAYLRDMGAVRDQDDGRLDRLGQRIEDVRERATRIGEAFGEVRLE